MPSRHANRGLYIGLGVGALVLLVVLITVGIAVLRPLRIEPITAPLAPASPAPGPLVPSLPPSPSATVPPSPAPWVTGAVGKAVRLPSFELTVTGSPRCDTNPLAGKRPENRFYCHVPVRLVNKGPALRDVCDAFWLWVRGGFGLGSEPSTEATNAVASGACDNPLQSGATWEATVVFDVTSGNGAWEAVGFSDVASGERARIQF
jgi:hypothetical protein